MDKVFDDCRSQNQNNDFTRKFKYVTTNFADIVNAKDTGNYFGINVRDYISVPGDKIESDTLLKFQKMTNCNSREISKSLPLPTTPAKFQLAHGDVSSENSLRFLELRDKKSVLPSFSSYSFEILPTLESISIEPFPKIGVSTRQYI
jgi:hypothetical protein